MQSSANATWNANQAVEISTDNPNGVINMPSNGPGDNFGILVTKYNPVLIPSDPNLRVAQGNQQSMSPKGMVVDLMGVVPEQVSTSRVRAYESSLKRLGLSTGDDSAIVMDSREGDRSHINVNGLNREITGEARK